MTYKWTLPTIETHGRLPTEDEEQMDFVRWFRRRYPAVLIHSIPNEGKRSKGLGVRMKAMGMVAGIPDTHIPGWGARGFWIEIKAHDGRLSDVQRIVQAQLRKEGDTVATCWGSLAAQRACLAMEYGETIAEEWR